MSGWAGGYVADVEYVPGYYRQQSPPHLALACLLGGVAVGFPAEDAHYLELGCGHGVGALLLAAANPSWRVTAVDYNPAHVASARALAHAAGITNATFLEADLATLAGSEAARAIPAADVVSLHGVWSWVSPEVQAGITRLLAAVVAPGGLVHVSYNALPGWQGAIGLQRVVLEAGQRAGGRSDRMAVAGLELVRELHALEASQVRTGTLAEALIERIGAASPRYLAHEFMNAHWQPCFHADVAAALAGAKLDWVASANLLESFNELSFGAEQRAILDRYDDPLMRELLKDSFVPRHLRHDLFVRGARRLPDAARDAALSEVVLALTVPPAKFDYTMHVPVGQAEMGPTFRPVVAALAEGPARVGALLAGQDGQGNPAELAGVLVGSNQAIPVARPGAPPSPGALRLNAVLGRQVNSIADPGNSTGLASARLGAAMAAHPIEQFVCARVLAGEGADELGTWAAALSDGLDEEQCDKLRAALLRTWEERVPVMRALGAL